jgi:hypothetical protein
MHQVGLPISTSPPSSDLTAPTLLDVAGIRVLPLPAELGVLGIGTLPPSVVLFAVAVLGVPGMRFGLAGEVGEEMKSKDELKRTGLFGR